jgi:signal transduction histidine kinase
VKDSGCGISEENQSKLFKLFGYLNDTSELNTQGVGLGLYITKMIVNAFDGQVSVESTVGVGSTFGLTFQLS